MDRILEESKERKTNEIDKHYNRNGLSVEEEELIGSTNTREQKEYQDIYKPKSKKSNSKIYMKHTNVGEKSQTKKYQRKQKERMDLLCAYFLFYPWLMIPGWSK